MDMREGMMVQPSNENKSTTSVLVLVKEGKRKLPSQ